MQWSIEWVHLRLLFCRIEHPHTVHDCVALDKSLRADNQGLFSVKRKMPIIPHSPAHVPCRAPLAEVGSARVSNGQIQIQKQGRWLNRANLSVAMTPDALALIALLNQLITNQAKL